MRVGLGLGFGQGLRCFGFGEGGSGPPLVSDAGALVAGIDDAAALETMFQQDVLHHEVVAMGIYAEVGTAFRAPGQAGIGNAFYPAVGGQAVDDMVGGVVQPLAVVNAGVGRVFTGNEAERADKGAGFVQAHIAGASVDFFLQQFGRRVAFVPLVRVAVSPHELAGIGIDVQQSGQVFVDGRSDGHKRLFTIS